MSTRDAIDEIVDRQLRKKRGASVYPRFMFQVADPEECEIHKAARWEPNRGWLPIDTDDPFGREDSNDTVQ